MAYKDESRFWFDMMILVALAIGIYYLKFQTTGETFSPFDGAMALLKVN